MDFVVELRHVLNFLQQHGFDKAAEAVYERLETTNVDVKPAVDGQERESSPSSAPDYAGDYVDQPQQDGYRSRSADPVLVSSRGASEDADDALEADVKEHGPWYNAEPLTTRLSGSSRLYEDPDIDEYDGMDDLGYTRRVVHNQQEFMLQQLDLRQDSDIEPYFHSSSQQYARNNSVLSGSASSSASLSSPGMSSCKQEYDCATSSWDHSQPHDQQHASTSDTMVTGDAAWDRGPAGIVIAEPVTTPTKDSRRSSNSEPKPCLSRVESLSNSFIDELESCDGQGDASRLSEAGSTAGDLGTPPRHSRATTGDTSSSGAAAGASKSAADCEDVIDLSPPSPPPDCAADAGIDLSNIFELGLRGSSRTSSVDVLYGSVRNWSEADSEAGAADSRSQSMGTAGGSSSRSAPGLLVAAVAGSAASKKQAGSKRQSLANQTASQPAEVESHQQAPSLQQQQQGEGKGDQQAVQQTQQLNAQSLSWQAQQQTQDQLQPPQLSDPEQCSATPVLTLSTTPATAATGSGSGPGFGFSFPTTPPSAVDAAVHEERAERVFSTWASNHSKSGCETLDDEEDTGNSQSAGDSISRGDSGAVKDKDVCETSWEFPATPAVIKAATPAPSSEADVKASTACKAAAVGSADDGAAPAASGAADTVTLAAPVTPFSPGSAAAAVSKRTSSGQLEGPASTRSRGGSRAHSSNMGDRAAAAGSTSSSRRKVSGSWGTGAGAAASPNSTATECADVDNMRAAGLEGVGYAAPMTGPMAGPSADADMASTGTGGYSGSGELPAPRYVVDEAGNLLYEYDAAYVDARYEAFDLKVIHRRRRTGFEDSKEFPIRKNDLIAGRYQVMDFLGSAAFSQAVQALDTATGALVCLKIIKNNKDYFDQSLDEIKLLRYVNGADPEDDHHIVRLYDFFYHKEHLFLVCELLRANLYEFQKYQRENGDEPYFTPPRIQKIAIQVLQSLAFLHSLGLIHSDLKPENILIKSYSRCEVKVIDLGSSCFITDHLSSYVQSRSYRAPEVILGLSYGQKIDLWSLGCILAELATGYVLFQNDSLATLLVRLEGILGPLPSWMISQGRYSNRYYTRSRQIYERNKANGRYELLLPKRTNLRHRVPVADEGFLDFLSYLLTPDPTARPSAEDALQHPWLSYPYPPVEQIPD